MEEAYPPTAALEIVHQILSDHGVEAEEMLAAMAAALVDRHVDVELRRLGRREPYPIYNERANALKAVNDAVHQAHAKLSAGPQEETLRAVMTLLMQCQFAAEEAAGIGGDDDDDEPPPMRLVRE